MDAQKQTPLDRINYSGEFGLVIDRLCDAYALAGVAMEFMGSHQEKFIKGNVTEETDYWLNLGRTGLRKEFVTK